MSLDEWTSFIWKNDNQKLTQQIYKAIVSKQVANKDQDMTSFRLIWISPRSLGLFSPMLLRRMSLWT